MKKILLFNNVFLPRFHHLLLLTGMMYCSTSFCQGLDRNYYYRITNLWQGDSLSLDILFDGVNNYQPILKPLAGFASQYWKVTPVNASYSRITNLNYGDELSLDIANDGANNRPNLSTTGPYSGQLWKITPIDSVFSRLTTLWQGDGLSLDILADGVNNNQTILRETGDYSGQFWKMKRSILINDAPCGALLLPVDGTVQSNFGNWNATVAAGEQGIVPQELNCQQSWCDSTINNSVWFTFIAPATGAIEINMCGLADFDSQMAVYTVGECNDFASYQLVGANDDGMGCDNFSSFLTVNLLAPDQMYYLLVDGYQGDTGRFSLQLTAFEVSPTQDIVADASFLTVAPNPASGTISILLHAEQSILAYTLNDMTGKTIRSIHFDTPVQAEILDISTVPKGVYMLRLNVDGKIFTRKVIVQ